MKKNKQKSRKCMKFMSKERERTMRNIFLGRKRVALLIVFMTAIVMGVFLCVPSNVEAATNAGGTPEAASTIKPRTSKSNPTEMGNNKWYGSSNNPFPRPPLNDVLSINNKDVSVRAEGNCTWYAFGRASEILGKKLPLQKKNGLYGNAGDWYEFNKDYFATGTEPIAGAIACWGNGTYGHVAVVESVKGKGSNQVITLSDSSYAYASGGKANPGWYFKYTTGIKIKGKKGDSNTIENYGFGGFKGYIYLTPYSKNFKISSAKCDKNNGSVTITWKKADNAVSYEVLRSTKKNKGYQVIKTVKANKKLSFKDTSVPADGTYYYKIKAINKAGKTPSVAKKVKVTGKTVAEHTYKVYDLSMTWEEAKAYCESQGGHLVTITSQEEMDFVKNLVKGTSKSLYWLGADMYSGDWSWITGEKWSYSNWNLGEPTGGQYVLAMYSDKAATEISYKAVFGTWLDQSNEGIGDWSIERTGFICEWDYDTGNLDMSDEKSKALSAYSAYLSSNYDENERFAVIDLDKDGIPELMCRNEERLFGVYHIFDYKDGRVAQVSWYNAPVFSSNEVFYWLEETGTLVFYLGYYDNFDILVSWFQEFAYDGQKIRMINDVQQKYDGTISDTGAEGEEYLSVKESVRLFGKEVEYYRNTPEERNHYLK